uniref:Uncharacterized protein n=1 Tax=Arundo donax TaxID=35708 RepID=A0A0A9BLJ6_ARUDO
MEQLLSFIPYSWTFLMVASHVHPSNPTLIASHNSIETKFHP